MADHQKTESTASIVVDDFSLINGITPELENRLHRAQIQTYAELASRTPKEILSKLGNPKGYSIRRIGEEDWIGQAQELSRTQTAYKSYANEMMKPILRQHYENFTLEFLLDEKKRMRRTRVMHVQSGDADTWSGWELERVLDFIARHTGIRLLPTKSSLPIPQQSTLLPSPSKVSEPASSIMAEAAVTPPVKRSSERPDLPVPLLRSDGRSFFQASTSHPLPETIPPTLPSLRDLGSTTQTIRLLEWKLSTADTHRSVRNPPPDQAFDVHLLLDLSQTSIIETSQISYTVTLSAKKLGDRNRQPIGELNSSEPFDNILSLSIHCAALTRGIYRLEALVNVKLSHLEVEQQPDLMAFFESAPLQVY